MNREKYHQKVRDALKAYSQNIISDDQLEILIQSTLDTINHLEALEVGAIMLLGLRLNLQSLSSMQEGRRKDKQEGRRKDKCLQRSTR